MPGMIAKSAAFRSELGASQTSVRAGHQSGMERRLFLFPFE